MKHQISAVLLLSACLFLFGALPSLASGGNYYFDMPFQTLLARPSLDAEVVYNIPVEVRLVGVTADRNWYKMKVAYDLLFLGHYEYEGWVHAPINAFMGPINLRASPEAF